MQEKRCVICLEPVKLETDIKYQNKDIMCVHYTCLHQIKVGKRIWQEASGHKIQTKEIEITSKTSFSNLSKRPGFSMLPPSNHRLDPGYVPTRYNNVLYPVPEYSVDHKIYHRSSTTCSRAQSSTRISGHTKWFSSIRNKLSYRIMPIAIRNKQLLRKLRYGISQNKYGVESTVFPIANDSSELYSSEILDWLTLQSNNESAHPPEDIVPQQASSAQNKKKVTIQDTREHYSEHNRESKKLLHRRLCRRKKGISTSSIGSQYSSHSHKANAADFMDWVTSAPKIPNGNMLILLDCRNKKVTSQNIGVQQSFHGPESCAPGNTAASLILDLLEGRKEKDHCESYKGIIGQESSVALFKACTTAREHVEEVKVEDEFFPVTVEEKLHHVISNIFSAIGQFSSFMGRFTKVVKNEFT